MIENMLQNAEIIVVESSDIVQFGSTVTFEDLSTNRVETYRIVGTAESNPLEGKISSDAPIARAIEGKTTGDKIVVTLPNKKEMEIEIIAIK